MNNPSEKAIQEMKRKGFCPSTIEAEKKKLARLDEAHQLIAFIEKAFDGVKLGNGIGLHESQGIDDYADDETRAKLRGKDEKFDWRMVSPELLRSACGGLCFLDAEGTRFHLPAYLIAELKGEYGSGTIFNLTRFSDKLSCKFSLLSVEQRRAVRLFLQHILADDEYEYERSDILHALDTFWTQQG